MNQMVWAVVHQAVAYLVVSSLQIHPTYDKNQKSFGNSATRDEERYHPRLVSGFKLFQREALPFILLYDKNKILQNSEFSLNKILRLF